MSTVYFDIEGTPEAPVEIGAVVTNNGQIKGSFHVMVWQMRLKDDWMSVKHVHGINSERIGTMTQERAMENFRKWFRANEGERIRANGMDIKKLLPDLPVEQVAMPGWAERVSQPYHIAARNIRDGRLQLNKAVFTSCSKENHKCYKTPTKWKENTAAQRARKYHGYHCALADAVEIFFLDNDATFNDNYTVLYW